MRRFGVRALIGVTVAVLLMACSGGDGGADATGGPDVQGDVAPDAAAPVDAVTPDATTPDGAAPDTATPDTATPDSATPDSATPPDPSEVEGDTTPVVEPKCQALVAGNNADFDVDGKKRSFILTLPTGVETGGPWPVIFNWHGFGDTALNMSGLLAGSVNGPYAYILVTPEDLGALPPNGMDWWILKVTDQDPDVRLYDEVLKCLDQRFAIDHERIHTVGFSAGAIMSDLLGVVRGDQIASIVSFSGSYFSNTPNKEALGQFASLATWPEMPVGPVFAQLLVHGAASDNYPLGVTTLKFNENGERDVTYLNGLGHDVVHCNHGGGHTVPVNFMQGQIARFFQAHPRGTTTTWADTGLPAEAALPDYCVTSPAP